jgi:hypothetical protein
MTDEANIEERYQERAAIMHFCGGLPKEKAEALARAECETYRNARMEAWKARKIADSMESQA